MKIKIQNQEQLEGIMYTWFSENEDCMIEIKDEDSNNSIYFISNKLPNNLVSLSVTANENVVGDVIHSNDGKARMKFVKEFCSIINFGEIDNLSASLNVNKKEEANIPKFTMNSNKEVKKNTPIRINTLNEAQVLLLRFLKDKRCNKIIFSFVVYIPDLKYKFRLDLVADKIYLYGRDIVSFTFSNMSGIGEPLLIDGFGEHTYNCSNIDSLIEFWQETMVYLFKRCMYVSKEEIELYVYSNSELI